jgi:hypothetical protein
MKITSSHLLPHSETNFPSLPLPSPLAWKGKVTLVARKGKEEKYLRKGRAGNGKGRAREWQQLGRAIRLTTTTFTITPPSPALFRTAVQFNISYQPSLVFRNDSIALVVQHPYAPTKQPDPFPTPSNSLIWIDPTSHIPNSVETPDPDRRTPGPKIWTTAGQH